MRVAAGIVTAIAFMLAASASAAAAEQYTVGPHDTLYSIARHFGVSVGAIAKANGLRDPSRIRAGAVLLIPDRPAAQGTQAAGAGQPRASLRQTPPASRSVSGGGPSAGTAGAAYTVRPGDTLYHLARTHGLTVADLRAANHLASDLLQVGQVLQIPTGPIGIASSDRAPAGAPPSVHPGPQNSPDLGLRITAEARRYLGTPYVWGGAGPAGVDCSGLVYLLYSPYVPHMPRMTYDQWKMGEAVDRGDLAPGDLVFFDTDGSGASHVGIYLGQGQFVHPALEPHRVVIDRLDAPYYASRYLGARRVL